MKCPDCGGAPENTVLTSNPLKYRCSECDYVGTRGPWMAHAKQAHAERLQAAREEVEDAQGDLYHLLNTEAHVGEVTTSIARLIDAKVTLALLERGS